MAATVEAGRLTEAHRLSQLRLGRVVVAQMVRVFGLLDPTDLDRTFETWLRVVSAIVGGQRVASARLAANYLMLFRGLELGVDVPPAIPVLAETPDPKALATSMLVTGPVAVKSARARGVAVGAAVELARAGSAAAAMRHTLNGGRDTIAGSVAADRRALGWARATSGKACAFCAMLASRGPVYSEDTVHFRAHDHCSCSAEPVYRRDADWPAGAREYRELWDESTVGHSGPDAIQAFRQALDAK